MKTWFSLQLCLIPVGTAASPSGGPIIDTLTLSSPFWPLTTCHRPVVNIDLYWATCMWPVFCSYLLLNRPVRTIVDRMATFKRIWPELPKVHIYIYLYLLKVCNTIFSFLATNGGRGSRITNCTLSSIYEISVKWKLISR